MKKKNKNLLLIVLVIAVFGMAIGYAALSQALTINGTANVTADWDVKITGIEEGTLTGATTNGTLAYTDETATFSVDLAYPGATATYQVTVKNEGNIDAILGDIGGITEANAAAPTSVTYSIDAAKDDALNAGATKVYNVTVEWARTDTTIPTTTTKTATITLPYSQAH